MKTGWYDPKYCEMLIKHMAQGHSFESFGGEDGVWVGRSTLYQWAKDHPEFAQAREIGQSKRIKFQESQLMLMTRGVKLTGKDKDGKDITTYDPKHGKPQILQWFLARQNPDIYAEKKQIDLKSSDGSMSPTKKHDLSKLSLEELEVLEKIQMKLEANEENETEEE